MSKIYTFKLILGYLSQTQDFDKVANELFEAGCDDATFGICHGVPILDFDRKSSSLEEAVKSATQDVQSVGLKVLCMGFDI
jgi:hypothetical protein